MAIRQRLAVASVLLFVLGLAPSAWAQFASAIEGTVTDPSGGVVPGATVTVSNEATGVAQTVQTTSAGYFRVPALPGGLYTVRVSLQGFKTWVREHIRLESTQVRAVNVALEIGAAGSEDITVTADAPLVETSQGRVSGLIREDQVQDLPLIGRNFFNLVVLTPGVTGRVTGGSQSYAQSNADLYNNEFGVGMNANGARTESNNFLVDSSTVSSSQRSGVANINPNAESVEEVRVLVNNFSAEYGRNGSVLVNVITKSGANDFHGSFGAYYTNDSLQSKNYFQEQTTGFEIPEFGRREFSWGLGGPVRKDKTFFFVSGDVLRSDVAVSRQVSILTPQFIQFMQQARPNNISTRIARDFPASFTPDRNFRTAGQILGAACSGATPIASPVGAIPCNFPVTGQGIWNETSPRNGFQWTARVDHHFNSGKDRLYAAFNRTTTDKVGFGEPQVYPGFTESSPTNSIQLNTNYTKILSSNVVNEAQFSWVRPYGVLFNQNADIPGISVTGIQGYQVGWGPNIFVQNSFNFSDVVTWTRGAHSMKFGVGYTREHADNDSARAVTRPTFAFDNVFDFANDRPTSQGQIAIDPRTGAAPDSIQRFHRTQSVAAFVQDEWKIRPNFTLSAGLRYEGFLNIRDASDGIMSNIEFGQETGNFRSDLLTARMVQRDYYLDGGLWGGGQHTLAPRVSFAWDPTKKGVMSIRGGVGRFYERMSNQIWDGEHQNLPGYGSTSVSIFQSVQPRFALGTSATLPYGFPYPIGLTSGVNQFGGLLAGTGAVQVVDGNIGTMYLDNWFLGVQRGIGRHMVVEANYIGSRGGNMYTKWDINRFNGDLLDGRLDRILPGFSNINYTQAIDESRYNGLALGLRVNRADLTFGAAYTLGKAIDRHSSSTPNAQSQPIDAQAPLSQNEGLSDFDVRHKLAVSLNYKLPGPSEGAARAILGGWQLGGVLIAQSGTPYSVFCGRGFVPVRNAAGAIVGNSGCDYNADGFNNDRPNTPSFGDSRSGSNDDFLSGIFGASDFPVPGLGQIGTLGRNTFIGPRYFNVDVALIKSFRVTRADVQLRLESFNLFNTVNLFNPVNDLSNPLFGRSTTALPGRIIQVSGRIGF
ncbi:MAG TPA: carboxypeptidase regulatory-like domain-containing protein [Vicinamibacteria bacterium]|nr:carboxypeptidase regulatory-like domain-containing protein [Vicinamibacteria bacterium]